MFDVLRPMAGLTERGAPTSINVPPSPDLAAYVGRHFAMVNKQAAEETSVNVLVNDAAFVRVLTRGDWEMEIEPDCWRPCAGAWLFGAQSRPMRMRVTGMVGVVGFSVRPSAWPALFDRAANEFADTLTPVDDLWPGLGAAMEAAAETICPDSPAFVPMETIIRGRLATNGRRPVDHAMVALESIARIDPSRQVADIARELGLSAKQLQRRALHCFGHTPKMILRRSRFLDVAATLRGIAMPGEEELCALRYYDQSHVNREFKQFIGMTPAQFERTPTPMLTMGIEARQARKLQEAAIQPAAA